MLRVPRDRPTAPFDPPPRVRFRPIAAKFQDLLNPSDPMLVHLIGDVKPKTWCYFKPRNLLILSNVDHISIPVDRTKYPVALIYKNGKWGPHDPMFWPKKLDVTKPWMACAPKYQVLHRDMNEDVLWWDTNEEDLELAVGSTTHGKVKVELRVALTDSWRCAVRDAMLAARFVKTAFHPTEVLDAGNYCLAHLAKGDHISIMELLRDVATVQRSVHALRGFISWYRLYRDFLARLREATFEHGPTLFTAKNTKDLSILDTMGGFTNDWDVARLNHCLGIPYWYIVDYKHWEADFRLMLWLQEMKKVQAFDFDHACGIVCVQVADAGAELPFDLLNNEDSQDDIPMDLDIGSGEDFVVQDSAPPAVTPSTSTLTSSTSSLDPAQAPYPVGRKRSATVAFGSGKVSYIFWIVLTLSRC